MEIDRFVEIHDYVNVEVRSRELGCNLPTGFAILPRNFRNAKTKDELHHEDSTPTIRTLLRQGGVVETPIERDGDRFPYIQENSAEWIGPVVFVGASVFTQNPLIIGICLNLISTYIADFLKGLPADRKTARLGMVIPLPNSSKNVFINYDGPPEGIKDLPKIIKEVRNGKRKGKS